MNSKIFHKTTISLILICLMILIISIISIATYEKEINALEHDNSKLTAEVEGLKQSLSTSEEAVKTDKVYIDKLHVSIDTLEAKLKELESTVLKLTNAKEKTKVK